MQPGSALSWNGLEGHLLPREAQGDGDTGQPRLRLSAHMSVQWGYLYAVLKMDQDLCLLHEYSSTNLHPSSE